MEMFNKAITLSADKKQLTFEDSRFYAYDDNTWVPSVTTILEAYPKDAQFYSWLKSNGENADQIRDAAGKRGSKVHHATELLDLGQELSLLDDNGYPIYQLGEWQMISRYVEFRKSMDMRMDAQEFRIVSKDLGMAGTIDRLCTIEDKKYLIDIKTSNMLHKTYDLQLEAYAMLLEHEAGLTVDGIAILWLNAKTRTEKKYQGKGWQLVIVDPKQRENNRSLLHATKMLWNEQNKDYKPKNLTLNLKYSLDATNIIEGLR